MVFPALGWLILKKNTENKLAYLLVILWAIGIIGTMMRHLWVSIFLALVACGFFLSKQSREYVGKSALRVFLPIFFVIALVIYGGLIFPQSSLSIGMERVTGALNERVTSLVDVKADESFSWRGLVWNSAYAEFKHNPLFGFGTGNRIYVEKDDYRDFIEVRNIHNSYLSILFQLGIIGFAFFAIFVGKNMRKLVKSFGENKFFLYKFSAFGMLLIFLFSFPFQPYLETNLLAVFFWLMLGISRNLGEKSIISTDK
jgi:O-antigen ligase